MADLAFSLTCALPDAEATTALGTALAGQLSVGDVVLLEGEIGAGKSHLARSIIQTLLGSEEEVPSPTYTLVQTYEAPGLTIWHADLYRLGDPGELVELGLEEAWSQALCLVEWPDRLGSAAPSTALTISLSYQKTGRLARFRSSAARWASLSLPTPVAIP